LRNIFRVHDVAATQTFLRELHLKTADALAGGRFPIGEAGMGEILLLLSVLRKPKLAVVLNSQQVFCKRVRPSLRD
jgi:hypothetical protein